MSDSYIVPRRLDDPKLIGFWTLDEFAGMIMPFTWGILASHVFIGIALAAASWFALRKAKAGRSWAWVIHAAYWQTHLEGGLRGPCRCARPLYDEVVVWTVVEAAR